VLKAINIRGRTK